MSEAGAVGRVGRVAAHAPASAGGRRALVGLPRSAVVALNGP
jgi:hypothetical protein